MKNQYKLLVSPIKSISNLFELNPQLLRELRGRFKSINVLIISCLSLVTQLLIVINRLGQLPDHNYAKKQYSFYCFNQSISSECHTDLLGNWNINWQLFWLDVFLDLSVVIILSLLVGGVYLLIADLVKEKQRGTLNFIQFSPQSAASILTGKILGVPILLYWAILLSVPFHSVAAFKAGISLNLVFSFDFTVIACCWLFYSAALLFSLLRTSFLGLKPWMGSGIVGIFLLFTLRHFFNNFSTIENSIFGWIFMFNPVFTLPYLIKYSNLWDFHSNYFSWENLQEISFYGQHLWNNSLSGLGFILVNYYVWQHWIWQGLERCFNNPNNTTFRKSQTYFITSWYIFYALGFTLQTTDSYQLFDNFLSLQCFLLIFFLILMALLSPKYQNLQDWTRYRHQLPKSQRILWQDLILGEKSPGIVAFAINLAIATVYIIPSLLIFNFTSSSQRIILGLILGVGIILLYGLIAQLILLAKHQKRAIWSFTIVSALATVPPVFLGIAGIQTNSSAYLVTFLPTLAVESAGFTTIIATLLSQWLIIAIMGFKITKQLNYIGKTETNLLG